MAQVSTSVEIRPTFGLQSHRKISSIVVTRVTRRLATSAQRTSSRPMVSALLEEDGIGNRELCSV
jgi:hypothetical protein